MRLVLALVIMLMLTSAASAIAEKASTGPFSVSFDLNTSMNYSVKEEPVIAVPAYSINKLLILTNNSSGAEIGITEYSNLTDSSLLISRNYEALRMASVSAYYRNISSIDLMIDRKEGFAVSGVNSLGQRLIYAFYWLDSKSCECGPVSVGTISVGVTSTYPLNVTKNLINTLHIERNGAKRPSLGKLF